MRPARSSSAVRQRRRHPRPATPSSMPATRRVCLPTCWSATTRHGTAVDETVDVGGRSIRVKFGPGELDGFAVSASNLSLTIGDFVSIEGDVAFNGDSFAGQNLEIFLGQGPARLENGDINPLAVGVLLTNARIGLIKHRHRVRPARRGHRDAARRQRRHDRRHRDRRRQHHRPGDQPVADDRRFSTAAPVVVASPRPARVTRFEALDAELSVLGQTLHGNFAFDRDATTGRIRSPPATSRSTLGAPGAGDRDHRRRRGDPRHSDRHRRRPRAARPTHAAGRRVRRRLPARDQHHDRRRRHGPLGRWRRRSSWRSPAGPYLRIEGTTASTLTITRPGRQPDASTRQLRLRAGRPPPTARSSRRSPPATSTLSISAGGAPIVSLTNGTGLFVVDATGLGGRLSGTIAVTVPGGALPVSGSFLVEVNTTNHAIDSLGRRRRRRPDARPRTRRHAACRRHRCDADHRSARR